MRRRRRRRRRPTAWPAWSRPNRPGRPPCWRPSRQCTPAPPTAHPTTSQEAGAEGDEAHDALCGLHERRRWQRRAWRRWTPPCPGPPWTWRACPWPPPRSSATAARTAVPACSSSPSAPSPACPLLSTTTRHSPACSSPRCRCCMATPPPPSPGGSPGSKGASRGPSHSTGSQGQLKIYLSIFLYIFTRPCAGPPPCAGDPAL